MHFTKKYNLKTGLALFCPITSHIKGYPFEIVLEEHSIKGCILSDRVKNLDWRHRRKYLWKTAAQVREDIIDAMKSRIRGHQMSEESTTITRSRVIELINGSIDNFATFYDCYCYRNEASLSQEQRELYERLNEVMYTLRTDKNYRNDLENMLPEDLTGFLLSCKEMAENHDLRIKFSYPKGKIVIVENENTNPQLIEKSLEKLELYGDLKIKNAIKEYRSGERAIRFSNMPKNQYGKTVCINDTYSHFVTEQFKRNTPEN